MKKMKMRSLAVVVLTVVVGVLAGCGNIQKFDGGHTQKPVWMRCTKVNLKST